MTYPLAWWSGRVAAKRGRSPWLGAAIGLPLPVIGLAVAWFMPRSEDAIARREWAAERADQR